MGQWNPRLLLSVLALLTPLSSATEITSTFTTTFPTTAVVTSSSAIAGCSVAPSAQITCNNGFYNTYGAVWQETCAATVSGGTLILASEALSLRACMSACAVRPVCSATYYEGSTCFLLSGDVTIIPGGPVQAAIRYEPTASPCVSTWLVTETGTGTSTWKSVYTVTPSPTRIASPTVTSSLKLLVSTPLGPSDTSSGSPTPALTLSVQVTTPSPASSSRPLIQSSSTSTSSPVFSHSAQSSSILLINTSTTVPLASHSVIIPAISSSVIPSVTPSLLSHSPSTGPQSTESPSGIPPSSFPSPVSLAMSTSTDPSVLSGPPSGKFPASPGQSSTGTLPVLPNTTQSANGPSSQGSTGNTPSSSIYTVTTTQIHTIISCTAAVTNCSAHQQTTYLTAETLTYTTTVCPDETSPTEHAAGTPTAIPQTATFPSEQATETNLPPAHLTSSAVYVTEIDVTTACPLSVKNCLAGERNTYTTTKTLAAYTTTYPVPVTDSLLVSVDATSSVPVIPAIPASTLMVAQSSISSSAFNRTLAIPHSPAISASKTIASSSAPSQGGTHTTTMNTIPWQGGPSATVSAPGSLFTAEAPQMAAFSTSVMVVLLSMVFVL